MAAVIMNGMTAVIMKRKRYSRSIGDQIGKKSPFPQVDIQKKSSTLQNVLPPSQLLFPNTRLVVMHIFSQSRTINWSKQEHIIPPPKFGF